jgi:hypothetical protein
MCAAETPSPPSLKPLPSLALPRVVLACEIAQQFSTVIGEAQP